MTARNAGTTDAFFPPREPDPPRKRRSKRKDLEGAVQRECLLWLGECPEVVYVERRNTGAIAFDDGSRIAFGTPGAADIWCLIRVTSNRHAYSTAGQSCESLVHVEIECKRRDGKGRLSPAQKKFKQFCDDSSIPYLVVTSAEEMVRKLKNLELLI